jgi:glycosyltransferase involved in cell wall biosynthesis
MRILQVLATSGGGVGRHVRDLAGGLAATGAEVRVAGPSATGAAFGFVTTAGDPGTDGPSFAVVEIAERPRPAADARAVARLRRLARDVDVVHAHGLRAGALTVLAVRSMVRRGRRLSSPCTTRSSGAAAPRRAAGFLERIVAHGADAVLGVSTDLVAGMALRGARYVDRALVPAPVLPPSTVDRDDTRASIGVDDRTSLLVTVARLAPQKGLEVLADALERLRDMPGLEVRAVVAGDGPLAGALRRDAERRDLPLDLLGHRDDVGACWPPRTSSSCRACGRASRWRSRRRSRPARRSSRPTPAAPGDVAGNAAAYARPGDSVDLAAKLADVLGSPGRRSQLRRNARERAGSLPTAAEAVQQVMTCYDEVTTRQRDGSRRARGAARG